MIKSERKKHNNSIRRLQIIRTRGQNKVAVWMSRKNITLPTKFMATDHPNRRSKQRWLSGWEEKITLGVLLAMGYYSLKTNCKYQVDRGFKSCRPCWSWVPIFLNKIIVSLILFDSDAPTVDTEPDDSHLLATTRLSMPECFQVFLCQWFFLFSSNPPPPPLPGPGSAL